MFLIEGIGTNTGISNELPEITIFEATSNTALTCYTNSVFEWSPFGNTSSCHTYIAEEDELFKNIFLFPNPATTQLTITDYTTAYLTLFNTHGQTVAEASNTNTLWLGNLPQGLYLLQLFDEKGSLVKTEKVVKE